MVFEFKFPDVGEGVTEGVLLKLLVKQGDTVKADQPLAEIETDKAVVEVPSPKAGVILSFPWKAGDTIKVGQVIVVIGERGEKYAPKKEAGKSEESSVSVVGILKEKEIELPSVSEKAKEKIVQGKVFALPKVRALAEELGVNISTIKGSGKQGEITAEDVRKAAQQKTGIVQPQTLEDFSKYGAIERVALSATRKAIARHMQEAVRIAPHAVAMEEADVTELARLREKEKQAGEKQGVKITFLPFIIKSVVAALKQHPWVNSSLDEQRQEVVLKQYYNIGVAVDTEQGLLVPVLKNADSKKIIEIAVEIAELSEKARARKISLEEMRGGTFTITNYGSIAGEFGVPIINYPEAAILGLGRIREKPVAVKDKGILGQTKIEVRKILPLSLSFDHRIIDGAEAARFMQTLMQKLENPEF